jgi:hypothetical protein
MNDIDTILNALSQRAEVATSGPCEQKWEKSNLNYWHGEYQARLRYMAEALEESEIWLLYVTSTTDSDTYLKADSTLQKVRSSLQYKPSNEVLEGEKRKTKPILCHRQPESDVPALVKAVRRQRTIISGLMLSLRDPRAEMYDAEIASILSGNENSKPPARH